MSEQTPRRLSVDLLTVFLVIVSVLGVILALTISWSRAFQVDEVETIHAAYNLASGKLIYRDFWQGHNPLLYWILSWMLPMDPPSLTFVSARMLVFALLVTNIGLSGWLTHRLGGVPWLTTALLVLHTTFIERGMEVRPDSLMTPLLMAALLVGTLRDRPLLWRYAVQAALLGLAFITTQKAAIASFAFGSVWLVTAASRREPKLVLLPCLVWALPFAGMLAALGWVGAYEEYVLYNLSHPGQSIGGESGAAAARFSALGPLLHEGSRNVAFGLAALVGLASSVWFAVRREHAALWPTAWLGAVWIAGLFVMPFPFPYSHGGGLPALAVTIGVILPAWVDRSSATPPLRDRLLAVVSIALVLAAMATSLSRLVREPARSNAYQLHLLGRVQELTQGTDRVFDLAGLYFRHDAYPVYLMTGAHYTRYVGGGYPRIASWLRENGLNLFTVNYRMNRLKGEDRDFLRRQFVRVEPNIFMSGSALDGMPPGARKSFEVTRAGEYRFDGEGELTVDGVRFRKGRLERGAYELATPSGIERGRIVLAQAPDFAAPMPPDRPVYHGFD
ncbi:MAG: hypothetical protein GY725_18615 [bacterium]|nr:hypothetical protein [bacterium]